MVFKLLAMLMSLIGICLVFELTPDGITEGLLKILRPKNTISARSAALKGGNKPTVYSYLFRLKEALRATGKTKSFSLSVTAAMGLMLSGCILAAAIKNMFLLPVFCLAGTALPFMYLGSRISSYEKRLADEMETTLSAITNSYIRSEDIISAVKENLKYIKPPLYAVFEEFLNETENVSPDIKAALGNMADKTKDGIFKEWVRTLIACQDDRTLKDTLLPVVSRLSDVRRINTELSGILRDAKNEYLMMALLVAGNIPLLYFLNKDWFNTLIYETPGKAVLGICGTVILVTFILMKRYTRPMKVRD